MFYYLQQNGVNLANCNISVKYDKTTLDQGSMSNKDKLQTVIQRLISRSVVDVFESAVIQLSNT